MIDIHCHLLPALDDGAPTEEISIQMCRQAYSNGYTDVIATPHHLRGNFDNPGFIVRKQVEILNTQLKHKQIPLTVYPGHEVRLHEDLLEGLKSGNVLTLADSPYILLELPTDTVPLYTRSLIYQLLVTGYTPIIAHPERNRAIQQNPNLLAELVQMGALSQLTWSSLRSFSKFKQVSIQLIKKDLIHFIASDAHDLVNRPINQTKVYLPSLKHKINTYIANASEIIPSKE